MAWSRTVRRALRMWFSVLSSQVLFYTGGGCFLFFPPYWWSTFFVEFVSLHIHHAYASCKHTSIFSEWIFRLATCWISAIGWSYSREEGASDSTHRRIRSNTAVRSKTDLDCPPTKPTCLTSSWYVLHLPVRLRLQQLLQTISTKLVKLKSERIQRDTNIFGWEVKIHKWGSKVRPI